MWQQFLKDYFNFTKKERSGIIILVLIILLLIFAPVFYPYFTKEEAFDHTQFESEIAQLRIDSSGRKIYSKNFENEYYNDYSLPGEKNQQVKVEVFFFDPNTASTGDWVR